MEWVDLKLPEGMTAAAYSKNRALELVKMWRASFERGVGVVDPHPLEAQLAFLEREVVPRNKLILVLNGVEGPVVAYIAFSTEEVAQLYVHVDHQGRGIGSSLLRRSPGSFSPCSIIHYIEVPSADFAVQRVAARVAEGGHDIPEADVRRRFRRGRELFLDVYKTEVPTWYHWISDANGLRIASSST